MDLFRKTTVPATTRYLAFEKLRNTDDCEGDDLTEVFENNKKPSWIPFQNPWWIVHGVLWIIYTAAFLLLLVFRQRPEGQGSLIYSPALEAIRYHTIVFNASIHIESPFTGQPRPELDLAWTELLQDSSIIVSGEDLRRINKTSIPIPNKEDSYWVDLSFTHELHCVKRLYQYFHKDYYFKNISEEQAALNFMHTDHCLEILRQGIMCRGDVSLIPMHWNDYSPIPEADFTVPHQCVNWQRLREWTHSRSVDIMKPGYIIHPIFGPSFPDGNNHGIGVESKHPVSSEGIQM